MEPGTIEKVFGIGYPVRVSHKKKKVRKWKN
jgi:hypothetical protein